MTNDVERWESMQHGLQKEEEQQRDQLLNNEKLKQR